MHHARYGIAQAHECMLRVDTRQVPLIVWTPQDAPGRRPLVLIGHGGSGHKSTQAVLDVMQPLVTQLGFVIAAIDGPVHGARRPAFAPPETVRQDFREAWAQGESVAPMVADWSAALNTLIALPQVDPQSVGWYGLSMGTAYGLPVVGRTPRVRCAVLGLWGDCRPHGDDILRDAAAVRVPVLFQAKPDDEVVTLAGARAVFETLGSVDKCLSLHPGRHGEIGQPQLAEAVDFLRRHLLRVPV